MESFPNFRKLWGRIETPLDPGDYVIIVKNSKIIFITKITMCQNLWEKSM